MGPLYHTGARLCRDCLHPLMNVSSQDAFQVQSSALTRLSAVHAHGQHPLSTPKAASIGPQAVPGTLPHQIIKQPFGVDVSSNMRVLLQQLRTDWGLFHAEGQDCHAPKDVTLARLPFVQNQRPGPCARRQAAWVTVRSMPSMQAGNIYQNLPWWM